MVAAMSETAQVVETISGSSEGAGGAGCQGDDLQIRKANKQTNRSGPSGRSD